MAGPSTGVTGGDRGGTGFAWLALFIGAWIVGGTFVVVRALNLGLASDVGLSPYHIGGYLGIVALAVLALALVGRAVRRGLSWRSAFPAGYGVLGAGLVVLLAYIVVDVAWREGVGIGLGIEGGFAPSRILLVIGLGLVAVGPLRAAVLSSDPSPAGSRAWPAVLSAGLMLAVLAVPGGFHPAVNPWLERPADGPEDDGEIWVMNADGSNQTRVIEAQPGLEVSWPAWSPDGSQIAYARWETDADPSKQEVDIWVANADGTAARALADGPEWQWIPRWTPDGDWVTFTNEAYGGPWIDAGPQSPEGGYGVQGPAFDAAEGPAVRPEADLWRIRADGSGAAEPIAVVPGDDRSGSWSPDGTKVAFDATRDGNTEIYVMNADGSDPRRLTDDPAEDWAAAWSPDGTRIAFTSDRSGASQIYVMAVDGTAVTALTDDAPGNNGATWSPDGRRIAFEGWRTGEPEIWSVAIDGSDPLNLSRSPATTEGIWDGNWAPDGKILFTRHGPPAAYASPLAREDLGAAAILLQAIALAAVALVLIRIRPPFGAFAAVTGVATILAASQFDQWRFIPAAIVGGLLVDVAVRLAPDDHRHEVAAAGSAAAFVLAAGVTVVATSELGWTPTLLLGVAFASGVAGWTLAAVFGDRGTRSLPSR